MPHLRSYMVVSGKCTSTSTKPQDSTHALVGCRLHGHPVLVPIPVDAFSYGLLEMALTEIHDAG